MAKLVSVSINTQKIDKSKLIQGKKGAYLNLTISLNDTTDQYGNNVSVWQGQTEHERQGRADRNFLGNGKVVWESQSALEEVKTETKEDSSDLPF